MDTKSPKIEGKNCKNERRSTKRNPGSEPDVVVQLG